MNQPRIVEKPEIKVIGIAARTTNEHESKGDGEIPKLWNTYYGQQTAERIPNRLTPGTTLGLYTEYENGVSGSYVMVAGEEVSGFNQIPDGMVAKTIPAANYAVFTTPAGPLFKVVPEAWAFIWEWTTNSNIERAFSGDFELYDERSFDPNNAQVEIYIALK